MQIQYLFNAIGDRLLVYKMVKSNSFDRLRLYAEYVENDKTFIQ